MMTLHDCIEDFYEYEEVHWFQEARITFSGTLYLFTFLSPHIFLIKSPISWYGYLRGGRYRNAFDATIKVMKSRIMNRVAIPDERLPQIWRYPFWRNKLRHLRSRGLLIFDVWYGPAVLHQRPSQRIKVIPNPEGKILRIASGELDILHHVCAVQYHIWRFEGNLLAAEANESNSMRYFFPRELDLFLECSGFTLIQLGAFPEFDKDPDETTWNVLGLARAV